MSTANPPAHARARAFYDRWGPWLFLAIALLALVGIWIGTAASVENGRQNAQNASEAEQRDTEQRKLLACFDDFASQLAGALPPVREASASRDEAVAKRDDALQSLIGIIVRSSTQPPEDEAKARERFITAATRLRSSGRLLEHRQEALQQAREDNPYPPPPSTFCTVEP